MKIIDFKKKGNVVRFYLGDDDLQNWWGDDWDDRPYECNAGEVYDEFIIDHCDMSFPFGSLVLEPCSGAFNSAYSKDQMMDKLIPCIVVVPEWIASKYKDDEDNTGIFEKYAASKDERIQNLYFGDNLDPSWLSSDEPVTTITWGDIFRTKMYDENIARVIYGKMTATDESRNNLISTVERIIGKDFLSKETYLDEIVQWLKSPVEDVYAK